MWDVLVIPAPMDIDGKDTIRWGGTTTRNFTIKSAYENQNIRAQPIEGDWKAVWSWKKPNKIQTFMRMTTHDRLLTNFRRRIWDVGASPTCSRCVRINETIIHVLRDCPVAIQTWIKPQEWWIKLNYKDSLDLVGCGGLFRKLDGKWIKGYLSKIETYDDLSAEMWGMYLGMELAWRQGFHHLQVESDSKSLVDMITRKVKFNGNPPILVRRIQELLKLNRHVQFNYTWREGNKSVV
ncbi:ribonuclease H [Trifolium pratense]|uniref:Ribonuclease H n=1 Tax=Trifolium pratense TaxID=57577 RepID=A0A2K3L4F9_TRIPR|nr:ribonuclease H [Trifolium pratense]